MKKKNIKGCTIFMWLDSLIEYRQLSWCKECRNAGMKAVLHRPTRVEDNYILKLTCISCGAQKSVKLIFPDELFEEIKRFNEIKKREEGKKINDYEIVKLIKKYAKLEEIS